METMPFAQFGAEIIGNLVGAALGSLIGALIIQLAARIVVKCKPEYGTAYGAAFLGYLVGYLIGFMINFGAALLGLQGKLVPTAISVVLAFFAGSAVYTAMLRNPAGERIRYGQACLISLIQIAVGLLVLGCILALILMLAFVIKLATRSV